MEKNIERLKIREAKVEDINDIMCLYGKTIWKIEQEFDDNLKKGFEQSKELYEIMTNDINDKNTIILIAELEKNLIGYISVSIISLEDAYIEKIAVLHEIAVEEEYQELGIGKSLLDSCIKILKDSNTLDFAINKPRSFRTSPELMYALIKKWNLEGDKTYGPFISSLRLYQESGKTSDDLKKKFDVKKVYGNDKYFSGR